jgi:hypothetical protein
MPAKLNCPMPASRFCRHDAAPAQFNGTYSVTSFGGVASTFLLEWFRHLELAAQQDRDCRAGTTGLPAEKSLFTEKCGCDALADGPVPLHLVSCHVDDDGVFKHLADPRALNRFGRHRALYIVGNPIDAVASVFRRKFQCWHLYRLNNCWFTRKERDGLIPCSQPGIRAFRKRYGTEASTCRVPERGPLSSLDAYAEEGEDLFGSTAQFRAWMSCRRPHCLFDILVVRYETLSAAMPAVFDFLEVPHAARRNFPSLGQAHGKHGQSTPPRIREQLASLYGPLEKAISQIPAEGLLLRNTF